MHSTYLTFCLFRKLNIIPTHLTRLLTGNIHPRLILSRLEMVEQLIVSQGVSSDKNRFGKKENVLMNEKKS